ncbi:hypothetical protein CBL_20809 [Carabus blaptoides fortunei]
MPVCVAFGCGNRSGRKSQSQKCAEESGSRISFHSFPKDPERRAQWITAVRRENWQPSNISRICSVHFKEDDFDKTSLSSIRLRDFAVPSIFPAFPFYLQKSAKPRRVLKKRSPQVNLQSTSSTTTGNIEDVQATPNFMDEHITDNLQTFSGSVYNISATELNVSAAYEYVRQKFDSNLPHPKTLYRWYKNMNGNPGFTEEAFAAIKSSNYTPSSTPSPIPPVVQNIRNTSSPGSSNDTAQSYFSNFSDNSQIYDL